MKRIRSHFPGPENCCSQQIRADAQLTCCIIRHFDDAFTITNDFTIVERSDADGHFNRRHGDGWLSC